MHRRQVVVTRDSGVSWEFMHPKSTETRLCIEKHGNVVNGFITFTWALQVWWPNLVLMPASEEGYTWINWQYQDLCDFPRKKKTKWLAFCRPRFQMLFRTDLSKVRIHLTKYVLVGLIDDLPALVHVTAWCRQVTSHNLDQSWLRSMTPDGIIRPQRVANPR